MKIIIIFLVIGSSLLIGCDDFLDEAPVDRRTPQNFYQNEEDIDEALAAIYNANRGLFNNLQWRFGENRSDNTTIEDGGIGGGEDDDALDEFLLNSTSGNISNYWNNTYNAISRVNFALQAIDGINYEDETNRQIRIGELTFFRSWFYFNLIQLYGDVPYVTIPGDTPEDIFTDQFLERVSVTQVYENILQEIQISIDLLPNPSELDPNDVGRVTRGAALMLKAKMHMALQQFDEAIPLLEQMRTLGYTLQSNYTDVFSPDNKNHSESVFEIQYSFSLGQSSNFFTNFVPFESGNEILGELGGQPNPRGAQNQPTSSLIDLYSDEDTRKVHNISFWDPGDGRDPIPWMSKYAFPFEDLGQQDINFQMFRYADALLMLAECYNEVGGGDPVIILEQIRQRALPDPSLSPSELANLEQTIADERRRELAFENHRFFDLLRTGKLVEVMTAHGEEERLLKPTGVNPNAYTNIRTVLGIPDGQVQEFGFTQNEGW